MTATTSGPRHRGLGPAVVAGSCGPALWLGLRHAGRAQAFHLLPEEQFSEEASENMAFSFEQLQ